MTQFWLELLGGFKSADMGKSSGEKVLEVGAELTPDKFQMALDIHVEMGVQRDKRCPTRYLGTPGHLGGPAAPFPEPSCSHKGAAKSSKGGETSNFKMHPFIWFHISKLNFNDLLGKCVPLCVSINHSFQCYMFLFYYRRS